MNVICFVSSESRLHELRIALASVRSFHPTLPVLLLYCEPPWASLPVLEGVEIIPYGKAIDCMGRIAVIQRAIERCYQKIVVLDNDMELFAPLDHIFTLLDTNNAVVTPHNLEPLPDDGRHPSAEDIVHAGNYNAGFFACRASAATKQWLTWWMKQTTSHPELNGAIGHFAEQGWLRFIGDYLDGVHVLRHAGYNTAYWNVYQRDLRRAGNTWTTKDGPLVLFHYSGFDPGNPKGMSRHQNRWVARGEILQFYERYSRIVINERP